MNPTTCDKSKARCRFEDSFSLPENQRINPDDPYAFEHEKKVLEKWHQKNDFEALEKNLRRDR
jgi:hypothetical protein